MNIRCSTRILAPKKMLDLVDFGINNPDLATSCLGEVLEQLYHTDKFQVLIAIDGINDWFKTS
jgi:hypothetical protein